VAEFVRHESADVLTGSMIMQPAACCERSGHVAGRRTLSAEPGDSDEAMGLQPTASPTRCHVRDIDVTRPRRGLPSHPPRCLCNPSFICAEHRPRCCSPGGPHHRGVQRDGMSARLPAGGTVARRGSARSASQVLRMAADETRQRICR
jgi:hypothetical protein